MYVNCDTYNEKCIKNKERKLPGSCKQYVLKSLDMKLTIDIASFMRNSFKKICSILYKRHSYKKMKSWEAERYDFLLLITVNPLMRCIVYRINPAIMKRLTDSLLCKNKGITLAGMHPFSGNDYVPNFFRKGKSIVWKLILQKENLLLTF